MQEETRCEHNLKIALLFNGHIEGWITCSPWIVGLQHCHSFTHKTGLDQPLVLAGKTICRIANVLFFTQTIILFPLSCGIHSVDWVVFEGVQRNYVAHFKSIDFLFALKAVQILSQIAPRPPHNWSIYVQNLKFANCSC